jgi:hypothetical protein
VHSIQGPLDKQDSCSAPLRLPAAPDAQRSASQRCYKMSRILRAQKCAPPCPAADARRWAAGHGMAGQRDVRGHSSFAVAPAPLQSVRTCSSRYRGPPAGAASITCSWSRRGSRSRCRPRSLAWAGGRFSPSRCFRLRRRTDRRHRTRAPKRPLRAASQASPGPLPFQDRPASHRSRHLPRWRARALRRPR